MTGRLGVAGRRVAEFVPLPNGGAILRNGAVIHVPESREFISMAGGQSCGAQQKRVAADEGGGLCEEREVF